MSSQLTIYDDQKRAYQGEYPTFSGLKVPYMGLAERGEHDEHGHGGCALQLWYSSLTEA